MQNVTATPQNSRYGITKPLSGKSATAFGTSSARSATLGDIRTFFQVGCGRRPLALKWHLKLPKQASACQLTIDRISAKICPRNRRSLCRTLVSLTTNVAAHLPNTEISLPAVIVVCALPIMATSVICARRENALVDRDWKWHLASLI